MAFSVPESTGSQIADMKVHFKDNVSALIGRVILDVDLPGVKFFRGGIKQLKKLRPTNLVFQSECETNLIIYDFYQEKLTLICMMLICQGPYP